MSTTFLGRRPVRSGAGFKGSMAGWVLHSSSKAQSERDMARVEERAREIYVNDAMGHGLIENLPVEVVGTGLTPLPKPRHEDLGLSSDWSMGFAREALRLVRHWGLGVRRFSDAQGRMGFYQQQFLQYFLWKLDGLGLHQVLYRPERPHARVGLTLLPIDPLRVATPMDRREDIHDGVELDQDGKPVAVWIMLKDGIRSSGAMKRLPMVDDATGLPLVLFTSGVRFVGEYRSDSSLGSMVKELRDNLDFVDAALVRAMALNMIIGELKMMNAQNQTTPKDYKERIKNFEQGMILETYGAETFTPLKNDAPGTGFDVMFDAIVKRLGMATGRGKDAVTSDFNKSYSAARATMLKGQKLNEVEQGVLIESFCQPAYAWLCYEGALRGLLPVKSIEHFLENIDDYCACDWLAPPYRHIDPVKGEQANSLGLANGTRTPQRIAAELGLDWRELMREQAEAEAYRRQIASEFGLEPEKREAPTVIERERDNEDEEDDDAK